MFARTRNHLDAGVLPLWSAVFCLDCEVISSSRGDECAACKSRSLVSLARMLGGSLLAHRAQNFQEWESRLFDITITVELQEMHAKDLSTTVERLTSVIGPKLARDRASFHVNVKPAVDKIDRQPLPKIHQTRQHLARSAGDEMRIELGMPVKQVLRFPSESSATHRF